MSSALYCTCMVFGILVVCPETDGNQLTWNEPLPILTVQESDANQVVHRNHTRLIEGTINASLSWYFNLSSGLFFNSLNLKLKTDVIVVVNSRREEVLAGFKDKYAINWIPSERITLVFFKVTTEQNATFACEVFAIDTFTSIWRSHVQVDVVAPPNNIVVSSDQIIAAPAELTLNCSADGKPTPTITWTRVSDNTVIFMPLNITGGKNAESYRCTAENGIGKPLAKIVNISILYQSSITFISANQTVNGGDLLLLDCLANGTPLPSITWTRLSDNKLVDMPLTITGKQDEGGYRCTAYNNVGNPAASDVFITVHSYHPYNTFLSTNMTSAASLNKIFYLFCNAIANPAAEYRLYKEDESIANITAGSQNIGIYATSVSERVNQVVYKCIPFNSFGDGPTKTITVSVHHPVEATGKGENATMPEGGQKTFSCPVNGNPEPNIKWYSEKTGRKISCERQVKVKESGCYTCIASNSIGTPINVTQCLIVGEEIRAILTIITNYEQAFEDFNSASSKEFVAKFVEEMDKVYRNMPEYIKTEVTQLRPGSVIVYFILYFKTALTPEKGIENLRVAISSNGTFGNYQAKDLVLFAEESTTSTTTAEIKCTCTDNETTLLVVIGVLVTIIILLIAVIIWQQRKLRIIGSKRPYNLPEERDAGFYDNEIAMKDVNPTHLRPKNSTQQQNPNELACRPLRGISPTGEGPTTPEIPAPNVEYAPLDMRTRSWEVARDNVKVEKTIGKGAFGQVAKGTAKNLQFTSGATSVAIKMVKANAPESDKRDLKSELELMKRFKPHPHVIKLLGCVTESEPLLVLIEYVPYGDLLGYLRKSRGLNDTYYKDRDIKPKTSLTSQQLMKFAWQIADGMSYLSLKKVIHRDLAARNVLVGERETCKITDFGMARDVQEENIYERKTKGRLPVKWTAYESLLFGQYTTKSDVWSYGVVLYEISTIGGSPYPRMEGRKIVSLLQQGYRMPKPDHVDNDLYQIMMNCWQSEPEARPSFNDLTQQLKRMENQHKKLIKMHIYDNTLYANLEDLNA